MRNGCETPYKETATTKTTAITATTTAEALAAVKTTPIYEQYQYK